MEIVSDVAMGDRGHLTIKQCSFEAHLISLSH